MVFHLVNEQLHSTRPLFPSLFFGGKGKGKKKEVLLSAAPQCPFPDQWVGKALEPYRGSSSTTTCGFSYTTTNPPCQYETPAGEQHVQPRLAGRPHRTRRGVGSYRRRASSRRCAEGLPSCSGPRSTMTRMGTAPPSRTMFECGGPTDGLTYDVIKWLIQELRLTSRTDSREWFHFVYRSSASYLYLVCIRA
jgi:hypothetical protein